ncbi:P-loop containing nucleoside triphosphate hydrolase protein [Coniochaeta sp. 2T2.1]|nr:P-loop containing nucleoside triphosphate hydrolase protein [Coniochaeta sp. 2T2.1]
MFDRQLDSLWKWRHKLSHSKSKNEKTLADFSAESVPSNVNGSGGGTVSAVAVGPKENTAGSSPSAKTYYEGPGSRAGFFNWVDYPPKQLSKSALKAQERVAIKLFKIKDSDKLVISGRSSLKYHMIQVQNPLLVAALDNVLKAQDVHIDINEAATFNAPFRPLYFGYDDIVAKCKNLADGSPVKPFMLLFIRVLDDVFGETRAKVEGLRSRGLVSHKLAWTYFPKDCTIISWGNNCELLCRIVDTSYQKETEILILECKVLRFNGNAFVWETAELEILPFSGNKPVAELDHYPLEFHKDPESVKQRLSARGRKVLDYQGLSHCTYNGMAIYREGKKVERHNVNCRILIDVFGYNKHHLAKGSRQDADPNSQRNIISGTGVPAYTDLATNSKLVDGPSSAQRLSIADQVKNKRIMLSREHELMFLNPLLQGYALKNKLWLSFFVEDIAPVVWNDEAYDHLVYDEQQKDLVMSFVESHDHTKSQVEDVIVGKGCGLIVLLSGPPGTGKTLMAEAVADRTHRPLFYLQAEDLGISAATLGANIKNVFEMATEWNAMILLDEADVFMAERDPHDIARNELVSIFLRELEYFSGIIFLTTNLYSTIDSAFRSRVSLHLLFNPLTPEARVLVWRKFLDRLPSAAKRDAEEVARDEAESGAGISGEDIKELAAWQLNGREIKNAVKMVKSWCDHKGYEMTLSRLENGIKVTSPHSSKTMAEGDTSLYD